MSWSPRVSRVDRRWLRQVLPIGHLAKLLSCLVSPICGRVRSRDFPVAPLAGIDRKLRWSAAAAPGWIDACNAAGGSPAGRRAS